MPCRSPAGSSSNGQQSSLLPFLSQEALPPELFDLLVLTLCRQAPAFATSLSYAKLVTAVLTMYQSHVSNAWRAAAVWCFLALGGRREAEGLSAGAAAEPGLDPGVSSSGHLFLAVGRTRGSAGVVWL